ncbi:hypothetical protein BH11ARM2_BH11ARM2_00180 [soil metagenome]
MDAPDPIFAGYLAKVVFEPGWPTISTIASVSGCMSEWPSLERSTLAWSFNRAKLYASEDAAAEVGEEGATLFAFWIYPVVFDTEGRPQTIDLDGLFPTDLPQLPHHQPLPPAKVLGYDVLAYESEDPLWGCSPLSCNGYGTSEKGEFPIDDRCLLRDLDTAFAAARCFQREQPEPGTYLVVRVEVPLGYQVRSPERRASPAPYATRDEEIEAMRAQAKLASLS